MTPTNCYITKNHNNSRSIGTNKFKGNSEILKTNFNNNG